MKAGVQVAGLFVSELGGRCDGFRSIVAFREFDQAETMAEGIGEGGQTSPSAGFDCPLKPGAGRDRPGHSRRHIGHDEIEVDGGPVTAVAAALPDACGGGRTLRA